MRKSDLRSGMVVETRGGELYLVVGDFITNYDGFVLLEEFQNNLKSKSSFKGFDIVKVYERYNDIYENYASSLKTLLNKERLKLLWEREDYFLTEREVDVLKALQVLDYKWLARDNGGRLYSFKEKPIKEYVWWDEKTNICLELDGELFTFIKRTDDEPTNIKELLK